MLVLDFKYTIYELLIKLFYFYVYFDMLKICFNNLF